MSTKNKVTCDQHGVSVAVLACIHIQQKPSTIFMVPADDAFETQAWCAGCEDARMADQGWYDAADAVAQWAYICNGCFNLAIENCEEVVEYESEITPEEKPRI